MLTQLSARNRGPDPKSVRTLLDVAKARDLLEVDNEIGTRAPGPHLDEQICTAGHRLGLGSTLTEQIDRFV